jgi:hypothetical protein
MGKGGERQPGPPDLWTIRPQVARWVCVNRLKEPALDAEHSYTEPRMKHTELPPFPPCLVKKGRSLSSPLYNRERRLSKPPFIGIALSGIAKPNQTCGFFLFRLLGGLSLCILLCGLQGIKKAGKREITHKLPALRLNGSAPKRLALFWWRYSVV